LSVDDDHRSRIRYLSKKNSRILTNFPKLKKFVIIRKKFVKCPAVQIIAHFLNSWACRYQLHCLSTVNKYIYLWQRLVA